MSMIQTVGRGVAWNTVSTVVGKVIIFANIFLILSHLSVYEYGLSELVLSVVATMSIFLLPGLSATVVADMAVERGKMLLGRMKETFVQFFLLNMVLGIVAWAVLFFGSKLAAHLAGNDAIGYLIQIVSFSFLISPFRGAANALAAVELRYADQSFYGVIEEVMKNAFLIIFFYAFHKGVDGLLLAVICSQSAAVLIYLPRTISALRIFMHADADAPYSFWRILQEHRKWGIGASYINSLGQTLQLWIIRLLLGTEAVGLFAFAYGIFSQVLSFLPLGTVLGPLLPRYADKPTEFARIIRVGMKLHILLAILLMVATCVGLPIFIWIFPKYAPAVPILLVIILSTVPTSVASLYTPAFAALKQQQTYFWSMVLKALFIAAAMYVSILIFGLPGIGLGTVIGIIVSTLERTFRFKRILPEFVMPMRHLFWFDSSERAFAYSLLSQVFQGKFFSILKRYL